MNARVKWAASTGAFALMLGASAMAQDAAQQTDMTNMSMPGHPHTSQSHTATPAPAASTTAPHARHDTDMSSMHHADDVPQDARSADYSDGYRYGTTESMDMHDDPAVGAVLLDRLEYAHPRDGGSAVAIDGEAWYGHNLDKLWLRFEGDRAGGRLQDLRAEALWSHAIVPFWDTQLGVRHDLGVGPDRTWAAFGIEGLAPYWFETEATFYLGQGGRTAARLSFEYEARFTQRLILQPSLEADFQGRDDPQRGIGSGLSDIEAGLRLRYEIRREFAPYIGLVWQQRFGGTRDYARAQGEPGNELQFVAGVRMWF